jgi:hypothetical protein
VIVTIAVAAFAPLVLVIPPMVVAVVVTLVWLTRLDDAA